MDLTQKIQEFCNSPEAERDYSEGALLLLQVTGNRIQFRNFRTKGFANCADVINRRLSEILQFRLMKITKEQVAEMKAKADIIADNIGNDSDFIKAGKRSDHDSLPDEVRAHYIEALDILRKQRSLHAEIRRIALKRCSSCRDSDMFPFVKEMIALDQKRLDHWQAYDSFGREPKQA